MPYVFQQNHVLVVFFSLVIYIAFMARLASGEAIFDFLEKHHFKRSTASCVFFKIVLFFLLCQAYSVFLLATILFEEFNK